MKYVRTKDGIFEVILISPLGFVRIDKRDGTYPDVFEKDILKQADTLKELIDEYVAIYPKYPHLNNIIDSEYFFSHKSSEGEYEYYGSIWIDGNLVKVAKMNEKGELELL